MIAYEKTLPIKLQKILGKNMQNETNESEIGMIIQRMKQMTQKQIMTIHRMKQMNQKQILTIHRMKQMKWEKILLISLMRYVN